MQDRELGGEGPLRCAIPARGALRRDRERLLLRAREQLVELLEGALVELERRARDDHLGILEMTGVGRRREVVDALADRLARELLAQAGGQRAPLVLVERRARGRLVEVLEGAATRLGAHELDAVVVAQHAYVVAHDPERGVELYSEVAGAGDPLAEALEDARAQRMGERFGDP